MQKRIGRAKSGKKTSDFLSVRSGNWVAPLKSDKGLLFGNVNTIRWFFKFLKPMETSNGARDRRGLHRQGRKPV
jgi:hypothetical protein